MMPSEVASAERFSDEASDQLFPAEAAAILRAVDSRRREFTTGRVCARSALAELGLPPIPIPRGHLGIAVWPDGVTGSITHCQGYRAAAVAWSRHVIAIGIDAEPNEPLPEGVLSLVSSCIEREQLGLLPTNVACWDRLLFSAKESVYKSWFPLMGRYLDFQDADVVISNDSLSSGGASHGTFAARLLVPGPVVGNSKLQLLTGKWMVAQKFLLTAIVLHSPRKERGIR